MVLNEFVEKVERYKSVFENKDPAQVVIPVDGSVVGGQDCVAVEFVFAGFDWDEGKIFLTPKEHLKRAMVANGLTVFEHEYLTSAKQNGFKYICRHPSGMIIISKEIPTRTPRGWDYNKSVSETTTLFKHDLKKLTWENGGVMSIASLLEGDN